MAQTTNLSSGVSVVHNGDFSGDMTFVVKGRSVDVPAESVLEMAAEVVRSTRIGELEQMGTHELLGLGVPK